MVGPFSGWHWLEHRDAEGDLHLYPGDGNVDVLGRDYDGYMHHYRTNSSGGWEGANTWGPGWGSMVDILGAGSYTHNLGEAIHWGHTVTRWRKGWPCPMGRVA
ncbi:hypothetical protein [Paenarthrobacter sp. 4246]|uniref:hypothetical protein n=1 Tax=Paenarthrobacter sp. 4246 TaxID=3156456 RepID=UPI003393F121